MSDITHKPHRQLCDPAELLLGYLDYYRSVIAGKIADLEEATLRTTRLPSGWTPLELVKHLTYMESRWFVWGFAAEPVPAPFGDEDESGRWRVTADESSVDLIAALHEGGRLTRTIVAAAQFDDIAAPGGRFPHDDTRPRPTLAWILVYVLQEYARHAGHLDIARELIDGTTGEQPAH